MKVANYKQIFIINNIRNKKKKDKHFMIENSYQSYTYFLLFKERVSLR